MSSPGLIADENFPVLGMIVNTPAPVDNVETPTANPIATDDIHSERLSKISAKVLWLVFQGVGCMYEFLAEHLWITIFVGTGPLPHDPGRCVKQVLHSRKLDPKMSDILLTMRRIRNSLHHPTHADGSSVYYRDVIALRDHITSKLADGNVDTINMLLPRLLSVVNRTLNPQDNPESNECPLCGQKPPITPPCDPKPDIPSELMTFREYKEKYGANGLKGSLIKVKISTKKLEGWYHGYFRSWNGSMVFVDLETVGRVSVPIKSIFMLN